METSIFARLNSKIVILEMIDGEEMRIELMIDTPFGVIIEGQKIIKQFIPWSQIKSIYAV